uniref:Uncharacterized protein n=1 Tax=Timspurckia oligopyrenoides TaxID=708627 RepID=A0A7S0ZGP5_9RHOD|mmetsp:Transcript_445/g.805  ORF Transcript_445/g.805 Transcript_445/m.805 type:complete len:117 (+) Transcript_445:229-579(+)|eukprot:CAMPEP_0182451074 /NCGR_PEP_ID=MMETSP1172-20130603/43518_1 /TAXON_ID=708627 /ORGANISM="Timspurckia oligopyrenoides, Strain CCMP3278" /LENGTH=116 /DNA_ID=CAMNT_0024648809 /DNA_START=170 /DNA_END=520 /DNA_ORIENTATION=+
MSLIRALSSRVAAYSGSYGQSSPSSSSSESSSSVHRQQNVPELIITDSLAVSTETSAGLNGVTSPPMDINRNSIAVGSDDDTPFAESASAGAFTRKKSIHKAADATLGYRDLWLQP